MKVKNPAFDYNREGQSYSATRRADPRIEAMIHGALGDAKTVLNVGAGAGSYEPLDRYVVAMEPSAIMRSQRPRHLSPALAGTVEAIPFDDAAFDSAMAVLTVHHWPDRLKGLRELRRVTKGPIVVMTFDPDASTEFWLSDYAPELSVVERSRYGTVDSITKGLGGNCEIMPVRMPRDCADGFQVAFYARPEAFLQKEVRKSQSAWSFIPPEVEDRIVRNLAEDVASGKWDEKYGALRRKETINCQLRLIVAHP